MRLNTLNRHTRPNYLKRAAKLFEQGLEPKEVAMRLHISTKTAQRFRNELRGLAKSKGMVPDSYPNKPDEAPTLGGEKC